MIDYRLALVSVLCATPAVANAAGTVLPSVDQRFESPRIRKTPDSRKHVMPLMGRLGNIGRECHGSFQGRGGFQLSLLEFYFKKDHKEIRDGRLDVARPQESLILNKSTNANDHEGGLCFEKGS